MIQTLINDIVDIVDSIKNAIKTLVGIKIDNKSIDFYILFLQRLERLEFLTLNQHAIKQLQE